MTTLRMGRFKVEKDVAIPPPVLRRTKYPFDNLAPRDSFFVPDDFGITPGAVRQAVKAANRRWPTRRFTTRRVEMPGERPGTRVWRVDALKVPPRGSPFPDIYEPPPDEE